MAALNIAQQAIDEGIKMFLSEGKKDPLEVVWALGSTLRFHHKEAHKMWNKIRFAIWKHSLCTYYSVSIEVFNIHYIHYCSIVVAVAAAPTAARQSRCSRTEN